jgi:CubicO group peptidase (beta-lactamase class C family)
MPEPAGRAGLTPAAGRLIEVVSGSSLDAFFDKQILGPLGMTDTGFRVPADEHSRLAEPYLASPAGFTPATARLMHANHLPGGADLAGLGRPLYAEFPMHGMGFGLSLAVLLDVAAS